MTSKVVFSVNLLRVKDMLEMWMAVRGIEGGVESCALVESSVTSLGKPDQSAIRRRVTNDRNNYLTCALHCTKVRFSGIINTR